MKKKKKKLFLTLIIIYGCSSSYPENPSSPEADEEALAYWEDVIASDKNYPENIYLTKNVYFKPGKIGASRITSSSPYYNSEGYPLDNTKNGACGPPEGSSARYSNPKADMTVLGSGGVAVWQFDDSWVIIDGEGNDFVLFSNHNIFNGQPDGSWNELAHVYVSSDNETWYKSNKEAFSPNNTPGTANSNYAHNDVVDLFGKNHTWANFREEVTAQYLDPQTGTYKNLLNDDGTEKIISRYFTPDDEYLGGDYFDLSYFVKVDDASIPWSKDDKMRFLKLIDDPNVLDGQDSAPSWMTGARLMSAMGINCEKDQ